MAEAGAPPEAIAIALEAIEEAEERRKRPARERKQRQRDSHATVTGQSRDDTVTVTPEPSPLSSPLPLPPDPLPLPPYNPPVPSKSARKIRFPVDFEPVLTAAARATVEAWPPGQLERELSQFKDHHQARGTTMSDWQAAFRSWITNAEKWKPRNGSYRNGTGAYSPAGDGFSRALQRAAEHFGPDDFG